MPLGRAVAVALIVCSAPACGEAPPDPAAAAVERTRTTRETYSLFSWNRLPKAHGEIHEEWGAEFHSGPLHRVETPENRIVANCETLEGTQLHLPTGRIDRDPRIAMGACGVNSNREVLALEYLGSVNGPTGPAERVKLVDERHVRTYDVAANGALVGSTYHDKDGTLIIEMVAVAMFDEASADLFSEESLSESAVPEEFRRRPDGRALSSTTPPKKQVY